MKIVTAITFWNDAMGKRMSVAVSEVNAAGQIIRDNVRLDRIVTDPKLLKHLDAITEAAKTMVEDDGGNDE